MTVIDRSIRHYSKPLILSFGVLIFAASAFTLFYPATVTKPVSKSTKSAASSGTDKLTEVKLGEKVHGEAGDVENWDLHQLRDWLKSRYITAPESASRDELVGLVRELTK